MKRKITDFLINQAGWIFGFSILICASTEDFKSEQLEQSHYCDMVAEGVWPNFKQLDCGETK